MSCIPSHKTSEQLRIDAQEQALEQQKRDLRINPRAIRRQHSWKLGHDPADEEDHDDPSVTYIDIDWYNPKDPDQRKLLTGGPVSGMPCQKVSEITGGVCGEMTRIAGQMSRADIMRQPDVGIVNLDDIDDKRWDELEAEYVIALVCPRCDTVIQMEEMFVPAIRPGRNHGGTN